jgi:HEPN domain-containing protein
MVLQYMSNKIYAQEWLELAKHNLQGAEILFAADHFTDVIGCEIQQAIEKALKSLFALRNFKILKTHNLTELFTNQKDLKLGEEELSLLECATQYYLEDRYPNPRYSLPPRDEIEKSLVFARDLLLRICTIIDRA